MLAGTQPEQLHQREQLRIAQIWTNAAKGQRIREIQHQGRDIAGMQMRAVFVCLMKEIADADRPLLSKRSVQGAPRKRERTGDAALRILTTAGVAGAGEFTLHCARVQPVLRVGYYSKTLRRS